MSKKKMELKVREMSGWTRNRMDAEMEKIFLDDECRKMSRAVIASEPGWDSLSEEQRKLIDRAIGAAILLATRYASAQCVKPMTIEDILNPTLKDGVIYIKDLDRFIQWKTEGKNSISLEVSRPLGRSMMTKIWR